MVEVYGENVSGQFNGQRSLPGEFNTNKHPFQRRKKTSSLDEVHSICKLQKHFGHKDADTHTATLSSPSLLSKWYFKFTILVDLYGPLKLVLIFAASPTTTLCIKYTPKLEIVFNGLKLCKRTTVIL